MKRVCPLLERETRTHTLDVVPAPWVVRECEETGLVFLENPPGYESLEGRAGLGSHLREGGRGATRRRADALCHEHRGEGLPPSRDEAPQGGRHGHGAAARRSKSPVINLLDLGCGEGDLLGIVMQRLPATVRARCRPHGVEISNELARRSDAHLRPRRALRARAGAGRPGQLEAGFFDLIVMSSFLEHEIQPLPLREAQRALRPGGQVLIKVPNYASWNRRYRGARWCGYRWPDHVNYFTPDTLRAMAQAAGLSVSRMSLLDRFPLSDSLYAVLRKG